MSRFRIGGDVGLNVSPRSRVFITFDYFREARHYELSASASGGSGSSTFQFAQTRSQHVRDNFFMLGAGGQVRVPLGSVFSAEFGAAGGAMLRDTALESTERNTNNFSVAADRDFTLEFRDDRQEIEFWARAKARAEARLSQNVSLFVGGAAEYVSGFGTVFNPGTGDQVFFDGLTTALGEPRGRWSWNVMGGVTVRFGRGR